MADLVYTSKGLIDRNCLEMREVFTDNEKECSHAIEYWLDGECVKRAVSVHIKEGVEVKLEINDG